MIKDHEEYNENKEHIGIADVSLISFGDNLFSRLNSHKVPNLNDIDDSKEGEK
jgi:hypothetical protein